MVRDPTCAALWLNSTGGALAYAAIGDIISRHSMSRLGLRITPHDVRDAAATTWAIFKPEQIGVARDLLGHSDLRTTRYYIRARGIEVSRAHNQLIAAIRRKRHGRSS
jgi:integrase